MQDPVVSQFFGFLIVRARAFLGKTYLFMIAGALLWIASLVVRWFGYEADEARTIGLWLMVIGGGMNLAYDLITAIIAYGLMMHYGLRIEEQVTFSAMKGISSAGKPN